MLEFSPLDGILSVYLINWFERKGKRKLRGKKEEETVETGRGKKKKERNGMAWAGRKKGKEGEDREGRERQREREREREREGEREILRNKCFKAVLGNCLHVIWTVTHININLQVRTLIRTYLSTAPLQENINYNNV
jgi:hypothetical protein